MDIWVLVWTVVAALTAGWIFPSAGGLGFLVSPCHSRAAATQKTKPGYMLSVGRLILKKKALFSGGRTTIKSFKRLNTYACSRSVSLPAEYK